MNAWNPDDWEVFAFSLLQSRHGALNVHKIPATHKGDFGIDYYCPSEAAAYQCYAVQEPVDIVARANRQKSKITRDTRKLISNQTEVSKLFLGKHIKHWMLIAPIHDSKDVNLHCATKTMEIRALNCSPLDPQFEIMVQDQASFADAAIAVGMATLNAVTLQVPHPTQEEMNIWKVGSPDLVANATQKLMKRTGPSDVHEAVAEAAKMLLQGKSVLEALRSSSPDLHEKIVGAVANRSRRLSFAGPQGGPSPNSILNTEIDNLISAIKVSASNLADDHIEQIAFGTVSEWIMRCPLDFI